MTYGRGSRETFIYEEPDEELKAKFNQWLEDGKAYAVPDSNGETYDEHLKNVDISREIELLKAAGWEGDV